MNLADGYDLVVQTAIEALRPDPELRCDEWAEEYVVLPKSNAKPGKFSFDHSYPARRVHQVLSPGHPCKRVVARVASQMFKTQTALNWIGSLIHRRPRNILALEPTDTLVKRFSARVSTMIRNTPVLKERVAAAKSRDSRNTVQAKDFLGDATLYMNTAGSAANLAEVSAPYIYVDEIDRLVLDVDGEGDPIELAEARATQYANDAKFFYTSSPAVKGYSKIDTLFDKGSQESYHVPCPHCGHLHELVLQNFHYRRDDVTGFMDRAWFTCPDCGGDIEERHKPAMLRDEAAGGQARWVASTQGDGETISFTLSAFYMPIGAITWLALARQLAHAKECIKRGDHGAMQVFYNTRLALSYENSDKVTTAQELRERAENYPPRIVPDPALIVTMAVDTQPDRLEVQIEGFGPGLQHWVLDYLVLRGDPSTPPDEPGSVWQRLDEIRRTPLLHASGVPIYMTAYAIDAGGANTQDVYNYGSQRRHLDCVVLHGHSRPNKPIISSTPNKVDIDWGGHKTPGGAELWAVGTDVAKDWLSNRMQLTEGPGAMHFHDRLHADWFEQMVVERPFTRWHKGRPLREWRKPNGARNEAWDVSVYNLALAHKLGLHNWTSLDWQMYREKMQRNGDLFAADAAVQALAQVPASDAPAALPEPSPVPAVPGATAASPMDGEVRTSAPPEPVAQQEPAPAPAPTPAPAPASAPRPSVSVTVGAAPSDHNALGRPLPLGRRIL
ncbi:phage terminase large subunit family protein [Paracidovorax wautersii]|uniref:Phage terminase, large subunit GpA n=1 Tax=Paracidovorax wautersii TaxID=1177982 RepID=A0A1I2GDV7_9BURK|nr:terminase gpA endonuclease subunit [Paracidovorax wautersii]SFF14936.1 Phage terminase, large subunit GpA [Paracidovorax wautersii]